MKKSILRTSVLVAAVILILLFAVMLIKDYVVSYEFGSSPFYLYIIVRAIEFLLPASVLTVIGFLLKEKNNE